MRTEIIFHPAKNPRLKGTLEPVRGYATAYGLVLHRSLSPFREAWGYWDVSDIETGGLVANGDYPGIEGAVAALVAIAQRYRACSGGFSGALSNGRKHYFALSAFPDGEAIVIDSRNIAMLLAGLNATAIVERNGAEHLVNEAAEVIRWRIFERTGLDVPIV